MRKTIVLILLSVITVFCFSSCDFTRLNENTFCEDDFLNSVQHFYIFDKTNNHMDVYTYFRTSMYKSISTLSEDKNKAVKKGDGTYFIKRNKMTISFSLYEIEDIPSQCFYYKHVFSQFEKIVNMTLNSMSCLR